MAVAPQPQRKSEDKEVYKDWTTITYLERRQVMLMLHKVVARRDKLFTLEGRKGDSLEDVQSPKWYRYCAVKYALESYITLYPSYRNRYYPWVGSYWYEKIARREAEIQAALIAVATDPIPVA